MSNSLPHTLYGQVDQAMRSVSQPVPLGFDLQICQTTVSVRKIIQRIYSYCFVVN